MCDECGHFFEEAVQVVYEVHSELEGSPIEYKPGCPKCKSPYIDTAYVCDRCGEYVPGSEACFDGDRAFCEDCLDDEEYMQELEEKE